MPLEPSLAIYITVWVAMVGTAGLLYKWIRDLVRVRLKPLETAVCNLKNDKASKETTDEIKKDVLEQSTKIDKKVDSEIITSLKKIIDGQLLTISSERKSHYEEIKNVIASHNKEVQDLRQLQETKWNEVLNEQVKITSANMEFRLDHQKELSKIKEDMLRNEVINSREVVSVDHFNHELDQIKEQIRELRNDKRK